MPEPRSTSPSFIGVQALAERALRSKIGVQIDFEVARYGNLERCAHLARGFQKTFTSMRAKARRTSARVLGEEGKFQAFAPRDSNARGDYDSLICQRSPLDNGAGWSVLLCSPMYLIDQYKVTDMDTGLPVTDIGKDQALWDRVMVMASTPATRKDVTPQMYDEAEAQHPGLWEQNGKRWMTREECERNHPENESVEPYPSHPAYDEPASAFDDVEALGDDIFDEGT